MCNAQFPYFTRTDARRRLAGDLMHYRRRDTVVWSIPCGGVPVAVEIALILACDLDIIT